MKHEKVLFISSQGLGDNASQAGHLCARERLEIIQQTYDVYCLCLRSKSEKALAYENLIALCTETHFIELSSWDKIYNTLSRLDLPILFSMKYSKQLLKLTDQLIKKHQISHVHIEWGHLSFLGKKLKELNPQITLSIYLTDRIPDTTDSVVQACPVFLKWLWQLDYLRALYFEKKIYTHFDRICVVGKRDLEALASHGIEREKLRVITPTFSTYIPIKSRGLPPPQTPINILLWGAYNRYQNVDAALTLLNKILPNLKKVHPNLRVTILGSNPPIVLQNKATDNIEITGFVKDPSPYFEKAHMAIIPLRYGAGIKVKVLECLAAGIPVITTPVGAENISAAEQDGLYVCNSTQDYAKYLLLLLTPENYSLASQAAITWGKRTLKESHEQNHAFLSE